MLFKIKSNPMHPLSGALPLPYVPARVTRGALVSHRHSFVPPRCRTFHFSIAEPLCPSRCLFGTILVTLCCGTGGFQEQGQCFPVGTIFSFFGVSYYFIFFFFLPWVGCVGLGSLD